MIEVDKTTMANYFTGIWERFTGPDLTSKAEVDRIAMLQQAASARRKEYAEKKQHVAISGDASLAAPLASSRKRMEDAETAHMVALQNWENKQSRQKSR
jgi:hypothetical protein